MVLPAGFSRRELLEGAAAAALISGANASANPLLLGVGSSRGGGKAPSDILLPTLSAGTYVAWYDATTNDAAKMTLRSASIVTATPNTSGVADRVDVLKNRITAGSPLPDLIKIAAGTAQQNGAKFMANQLGGFGGLYFDANERGLATATGTGITLSTSTPYTVVDIFTVDRARTAATTARYGIQSFVGTGTAESAGNNCYVATGTAAAPLATGSTGPNPGCIGVNAWNTSATSANVVNDATARDTTMQTVCVIRRCIPSAGGSVSGQSAGTVRTWINGTLAGTATLRDSTGVSRIAIGNAPGGGATTFSPNLHHETVILTGLPTDADIAALTAWAQQRYANQIGVARTPIDQNGWGQSNELGMRDGNWAGTGDGADYQKVTQNQVIRQLFGAVGVRDWGRSPPSASQWGRGATALLRSWEAAAVPGTTLASPSTAFFDDMGSTDPNAWVLNTAAGSAGAQLSAAIASLPDPSKLGYLVILQGESGFPTLGSVGTSYNAEVTGSIYKGELGEAAAGRRYAALTRAVAIFRSLTGNSNLRLGIDVANVGNDLTRSIDILWAINNPTLGFLASANPYHVKVPDISVAANTDHYSTASYYRNAIVRARAVAWAMDASGNRPTGNLSRPAYGQFPTVASVAATVGNNFIDVRFNMPNGGSLVLGSNPTRGWEVFAATTSVAMGTSGFNIETGGSPLTITGVALAPGRTDTVRLTLSANLTAGKRTVFYGRVSSSGVANGAGFLDMLTDDAGTSAAVEPYVESRFRMNMPAALFPYGVAVTV